VQQDADFLGSAVMRDCSASFVLGGASQFERYTGFSLRGKALHSQNTSMDGPHESLCDFYKYVILYHL
jgi:hypothetical protein